LKKNLSWKKHFLLELYRKGMSREMIVALEDSRRAEASPIRGRGRGGDPRACQFLA
jgi:hypothetical protein